MIFRGKIEEYLSIVFAPTEVGESLYLASFASDRLFGEDCDAIVLVIVSLISLMRDQVSNHNSRGIRAYFESERKTRVLSSSGKSPKSFCVVSLLIGLPVRATPNPKMATASSVQEKDKMADRTPRRFCVFHSLLKWGRFLRGGDGSFQVV